MYCPFCNHADTKVIDSRLAGEGAQVRRRRECEECGEHTVADLMRDEKAISDFDLAPGNQRIVDFLFELLDVTQRCDFAGVGFL